MCKEREVKGRNIDGDPRKEEGRGAGGQQPGYCDLGRCHH